MGLDSPEEALPSEKESSTKQGLVERTKDFFAEKVVAARSLLADLPPHVPALAVIGLLTLGSGMSHAAVGGSGDATRAFIEGAIGGSLLTSAAVQGRLFREFALAVRKDPSVAADLVKVLRKL